MTKKNNLFQHKLTKNPYKFDNKNTSNNKTDSKNWFPIR